MPGPWGSVFLREHDRQHAGRDRRIGGVLRAELQRSIIGVDLPEVALPSEIEGTEVVLQVGVVVRIERIEGCDLVGITRALTSDGSASTPAVSITRPPVIVRRNASFKARMRAVLSSMCRPRQMRSARMSADATLSVSQDSHQPRSWSGSTSAV